MGKINEDNQNLYKENTNLYNETSNIPKVNNLNLNKFHNTQITISRGKIQIKDNSSVSPLDQRVNISKNHITNKNSNSVSKDINNSIFNKDNQIIITNNQYPLDLNDLKTLWTELGIKDTYKNYFEYVVCELDNNVRKEYIDFEMNNLKKVKEQIQKLTKEIQAREKTILLLYKFDKILSKNELDKKIKEDIIQTIKNLRILSMNIINHYIRIKESTSHHIINKKYDPELINKLIYSDKNYLIKMKNDTDFLYNSSMKKYFDFAPESDPFLIAISGNEKDNDKSEKEYYDNGNINKLEDESFTNNPEKVNIKIPKEIFDMIKNCQFLILQELIYNEINSYTICNKGDIISNTGKSSISIKSVKNGNKNIPAPANKFNMNHTNNGINRNLYTNNNIYYTEKTKQIYNHNKNGITEGENLLKFKNRSNTKVMSKNNLRPITDNESINNHNYKSLMENDLSNPIKNNNSNENLLTNFISSKTPDNKNLLGYQKNNNISELFYVSGNQSNNFPQNTFNKKLLNFSTYNNSKRNSFNNKSSNKIFVKLDNGIASYEKEGSILDIGSELNHKNNNKYQNDLMNDFKNIESFLNDSKSTKKTDISNIINKDIPLNEKNKIIINPIENLIIGENNESNKMKNIKKNSNTNKNVVDNNVLNNYSDKVNFTDVSGISHKNNTPNKVIIKEKIFIEDKKNFSDNNDAAYDIEETGRVVTRENMEKMSMELEKLRADVLENHYFSTIEKINSNNLNKKIQIKERVNNINNQSNNYPNQNQNNRGESNTAIKKIKPTINIPPSGVNKGKIVEKSQINALNSNMYPNLTNNIDKENELLNNLDKSLIQKKKLESESQAILKNKMILIHKIGNPNLSNSYKKEQNFQNKEEEEADISNFQSTEKSNKGNNQIFEYNHYNSTDNNKDEIVSRLTRNAEEVKSDEININEKYEVPNFKNFSEINEQKNPEDKILTIKLMKKIDYALMSSDEFSVKGDRIGASITTNRLSTRYNNLEEIKENDKSLNEENKTRINENQEVLKIENNELKINHKNDYYLSDSLDQSINLVNKITKELIKEETLQNNKFANRVTNVVYNNENEKQIKINSDHKINDLENIIDKENKYIHNTTNETIKISECKFNELTSIYNDYYNIIDSEQKIIFNLSENIEYYLKGGFPKFIEIRDSSSKLISLSSFNYDKNFSTGIRLVLSSFSVIDIDKYYEYAEKTIIFFKKNIPNTEIYIELHYGVNNEKFYVNEKLRDVFSKQLKFKWITLENTGTQRIVKYRLLNQDFNLEEILNTDYKEDGDYSIRLNKIKKTCENLNSIIDVKINTMVTFKEIEEENYENDANILGSPREFTREETDVNIFPAIFLLCELINQNGFRVNNQNLKMFSNEKTRKIARKFIQSKTGTSDEIIDYIGDKIQKRDLPEIITQENELNTALIYITNRFKNILSFEKNQFIYNKLQFEEFETLRDPETTCDYYLLRTTDENYSLFIGEINEKNNFILDDNLNKCENFYKLYSSLEQLQSNETKIIYLPSFSYEKKMIIENPKFLSDIKLQKRNEYENYEEMEEEEENISEFSVNKFFQSFSIKIGHDLSYNENFSIEPKENEIFIKKDFIFALINLEVSSDLNIPAISFNIISKNYWKKA